MKLNYKRVVLVGMAFFLISAFWQAYDSIIPLILTNHFGLPQSASGAVMSLVSMSCFNLLADMRTLAILWFVFGLSGAAYTVLFKNDVEEV